MTTGESLGNCAWCHDTVWSDHDHYIGDGYAFHASCARSLKNTLAELRAEIPGSPLEAALYLLRRTEGVVRQTVVMLDRIRHDHDGWSLGDTAQLKLLRDIWDELYRFNEQRSASA